MFADVDECASAPCQNDGSCIEQLNSYSCNCYNGTLGTNCETGTSWGDIFHYTTIKESFCLKQSPHAIFKNCVRTMKNGHCVPTSDQIFVISSRSDRNILIIKSSMAIWNKHFWQSNDGHFGFGK